MVVGDTLFTEWKEKKKDWLTVGIQWVEKRNLCKDCILGKARKVWRCEFQKKKKKKNPYITDWEKMKTVRKQWTLLDNSS